MSDSISCSKGSIAVFTSGGDAPGMNAVVRAVVRTGLHYGRDVYAIHEGYQGMVDGHIQQMTKQDVGLIIQKGGTIIGSARCMDFKEREGRLKAALNLVNRNITNLICCGGDGSLTGANLFKNEWRSLTEELKKTDRITAQQLDDCRDLNLIGLVGSIDNDMVYDGDLTIGTDTALNRIVECIDAVVDTAHSHQRTFVLEVMGRHCGYLAWGAAICTGADFVMVPEAPLEDNWEEVLCYKLDRRKQTGRRLNLIIVAEGAIDVHNKPIKTDYVVKVIRERLGYDTRSTVLGHVQRGGKPSAYDRLMATMTASTAVEQILKRTPDMPAQIVGLRGTKVVMCPLVETVAATQKVAQLSGESKFEEGMIQRGGNFKEDYQMYLGINGTKPKIQPGGHAEGKAIAVMHVGAPAAGMNSAARTAVRYGLNLGYKVYGVHGGFIGLEADDMEEMNYFRVSLWGHIGGAQLGTNRAEPNDMKKIVEVIKKRNICGLMIIGGFEAFKSIIKLEDFFTENKEYDLPIVQIPATISNNIPGTEFSVGSDTSVNAIVDAVDRLKFSADASRKRLFIVETQGANCGYLAFISAIASGATRSYTREQGVSLDDLMGDLRHIHAKLDEGSMQHMVFVRNENCSPSYDMDFMTRLFQEEGRGSFTVRNLVMGHLCQGLHPSPLDRIRATQYSVYGLDHLNLEIKKQSTGKHVAGTFDGNLRTTNINDLRAEVDFQHRVPNNQWFTNWFTLSEKLHREGEKEALCKLANKKSLS